MAWNGIFTEVGIEVNLGYWGVNGVDRGDPYDPVYSYKCKVSLPIESFMILYNYIISLEYVYYRFSGIVIYMVADRCIISTGSNKVDWSGRWFWFELYWMNFNAYNTHQLTM